MGLANAFSEEQDPEIGHEEIDYLIYLLDHSSYDIRQREFIKLRIESETDPEEMERIKLDLMNNNLGIDGIVNPSQRDINNHLKRFI